MTCDPNYGDHEWKTTRYLRRACQRCGLVDLPGSRLTKAIGKWLRESAP